MAVAQIAVDILDTRDRDRGSGEAAVDASASCRKNVLGDFDIRAAVLIGAGLEHAGELQCAIVIFDAADRERRELESAVDAATFRI